MKKGKYFIYKDVVCMSYRVGTIEYLSPIRLDKNIGNGNGGKIRLTDEVKDQLKPVTFKS